jgi:hypothetical protein
MNHSEQSPIEKLNPNEKWYRFNSLSFEIQGRIIKLLIIAKGDGLEPIIARAKLDKLHGITDAKIIESRNTIYNFNYDRNFK